MNLKIISLFPLANENNTSLKCDYIAFKSTQDINSFIGNKFDFTDFYNNLIKLKEFTSDKISESLYDQEKFKVYIYPNHKNMLCMLEKNAFIEIFNNDKLSKTITIPSGGLLNVINNENNELEVKLIAENIT